MENAGQRVAVAEKLRAMAFRQKPRKDAPAVRDYRAGAGTV